MAIGPLEPWQPLTPLPLVRLWHAVAHPAMVENVDRVARVVAELAAQPLDVGPHDLGVAMGVFFSD